MKLIAILLQIASAIAVVATCTVGLGLVCRIAYTLWHYGWSTF